MTKNVYVANIEKAFLHFIKKDEYTPVIPVLIQGEKFELLDSFFSYMELSFDTNIKKFVGKTKNKAVKVYVKQVNAQWNLYKHLHFVLTNPKAYILKKLKRDSIIMYCVTFALLMGMATTICMGSKFEIFAYPAFFTIFMNIKIYMQYRKVEKKEITIDEKEIF